MNPNGLRLGNRPLPEILPKEFDFEEVSSFFANKGKGHNAAVDNTAINSANLQHEGRLMPTAARGQWDNQPIEADALSEDDAGAKPTWKNSNGSEKASGKPKEIVEPEQPANPVADADPVDISVPVTETAPVAMTDPIPQPRASIVSSDGSDIAFLFESSWREALTGPFQQGVEMITSKGCVQSDSANIGPMGIYGLVDEFDFHGIF